jgi:hypothetical protein
MKMKRLFAVVAPLALAAVVGATYHNGYASDHDDGETDLKSRALNLTDHYAFRSDAGATLSLIMYVNPRSLPGRQYYLSENARYEFHVNKVAAKTDAPANSNDYTFRIEAGAPTPAGVQPLTLTVLQGTTVVGMSTGTSTSFAASRTNTAVTVNTSTIGTFSGLKLFVGQRSDGFHFDVNRFSGTPSENSGIGLAAGGFGAPDTNNRNQFKQSCPNCPATTISNSTFPYSAPPL